MTAQEALAEIRRRLREQRDRYQPKSGTTMSHHQYELATERVWVMTESLKSLDEVLALVTERSS